MRTVMREDWDGRGRRGMEERERGGICEQFYKKSCARKCACKREVL